VLGLSERASTSTGGLPGARHTDTSTDTDRRIQARRQTQARREGGVEGG